MMYLLAIYLNPFVIVCIVLYTPRAKCICFGLTDISWRISHDVWVEDSRKDMHKKRDAAERELQE
jgi:hypothetical protein